MTVFPRERFTWHLLFRTKSMYSWLTHECLRYHCICVSLDEEGGFPLSLSRSLILKWMFCCRPVGDSQFFSTLGTNHFRLFDHHFFPLLWKALTRVGSPRPASILSKFLNLLLLRTIIHNLITFLEYNHEYSYLKETICLALNKLNNGLLLVFASRVGLCQRLGVMNSEKWQWPWKRILPAATGSQEVNWSPQARW